MAIDPILDPKLIIISPADNMVGVDGRFFMVDCSGVDPTIYHVQWHPYRNTGVIEYDNSEAATPEEFIPNLPIDDFTPYQPLLDAWEAARDLADNPPPQAPSPGDVHAIVVQSQRANQSRRANKLAAQGKVWEAWKMLME